MSLPLTRRIAKTVLLTAAGAASVVGTAGAASAVELPTTTDVGGLSHPDNAIGSAAQGAKALNPMSHRPVDAASGAAASGVKAAGSDADRVAPETRKFAGNTADGAAEGATEGLRQQAPKTQQLPAKTAAQPQRTLDRAAPAKGLLGSQKVLPNGLGTASIAGL
ncbi:hypothetical protein [Streptomyces sp. WMMB 322]|uniref:hypothetical protein n=1 Tax=Streptomyces sp. WMMB 322 TaxID=1286821 RepID=UPI0006E2EA39|nr:hypothetical protein [Streptomyces sp. WMMB 322]SCK32264.1 hypothetical protein H180DRAFT_02607 [Streptomyces sp. WMMB 322]